MKIVTAKHSGFCFGVKRSVGLAQKALKEAKKPLYSLGPIIHNNNVICQLENDGLKVVDDLANIKKGTMVIRTHGLTPEQIKEVKEKGLEIIDTTCPYVKASQRICQNLVKQGITPVIVGDRGHAEIKSLLGFSGGRAAVVNGQGVVDLNKIKAERVGLVAQTTLSKEKYKKIISKLAKNKFKEVKIFDTICNDASLRQACVKEVAKDSDLVLIIGGKHSANTGRLYDICCALGVETYHIESAEELKKSWVKNKKKIALAGGASTPDWIIKSVKEKIKSIKKGDKD